MERVSATAPTPEIFMKMDEMMPETDGLMMIGNGIDIPVCSKEEDDYKKTLELQMLKSIGKSMEREWIVENQGEDTEQSRDEQHALDTAKSTREKVGEKYGISYLWKKGCPSLKSNVNYVKSRLDALMRMKRFTPAVKRQYAWEEKGYIKRLPVGCLKNKEAWYIPHLPVICEDRNSTKIRSTAIELYREGLRPRRKQRPETIDLTKSQG